MHVQPNTHLVGDNCSFMKEVVDGIQEEHWETFCLSDVASTDVFTEDQFGCNIYELVLQNNFKALAVMKCEDYNLSPSSGRYSPPCARRTLGFLPPPSGASDAGSQEPWPSGWSEHTATPPYCSLQRYYKRIFFFSFLNPRHYKNFRKTHRPKTSWYSYSGVEKLDKTMLAL